MKILFVADGRSPIALNWIRYFTERGWQVHLYSLYPCAPELELASLTIATGLLGGGRRPDGSGKALSGWRRLVRRAATPRLRTALRHRLAPVLLPRIASNLRAMLERVRPDLIHAMRIPYEGMVAALAQSKIPLVISVWGNDFTLHARSTATMGRLTRLSMGQATALHTDCQRDLRLAHSWGFRSERPAVVVPGGGGVKLDVFFPPEKHSELDTTPGLTVINPRGLRVYVRNDVFFQAIPRVLAQRPETRFLCPAMDGEPQAIEWVARLRLGNYVDLLPRLTQDQMATAFRQADIAVSPSTHDGTPNTLLEAMACGSFPVAGDLESLREWIAPGENGLLVDPANPDDLAQAILQAISSPDLRAHAREINLSLVKNRADYEKVMAQAEAFYISLIGSSQDPI